MERCAVAVPEQAERTADGPAERAARGALSEAGRDGQHRQADRGAPRAVAPEAAPQPGAGQPDHRRLQQGLPLPTCQVLPGADYDYLLIQ